MVAPFIPIVEALSDEAKQFVACVQERKKPMVDGEAGAMIVKVLEASQESIKNEGKKIILEKL